MLQYSGWGGMMDQWFAMLPHSKKVLQFPLCVEFACSPHVCVGFLWIYCFIVCLFGSPLATTKVVATLPGVH